MAEPIPPNPNPRPDPGPRPQPAPHPRPHVDCDKIKHTCEALIAQGYPVEIAHFLYAAVGCGQYPGPVPPVPTK